MLTGIFLIVGKLKKIMTIRRIYHPYWDWECWKAGMYARRDSVDGKEKYAEFLSDIPRFNLALCQVITKWPMSCEHFLTDPNINRIAWLGQASMCIETGISRQYRSGFMLLSGRQQNEANYMAEIHLRGYLESLRIH